MAEVLTFAEIRSRFKSEWILVEDPEVSETLEIQSGKVLWHSAERDEVYRKARELHPKHSAILFTGELPANTAIVL